MKTNMRKVLIALLSLILVVGMSSTAFAYTPQEDDGDYSKQKEGSMHVIYCNQGMLRINDEGTTAVVSEDGKTVEVTATTSSSNTWGTITKLALIEQDASVEEKDAAASSVTFTDSRYSTEAVSRVIKFSIPVQEVGMRIPVCRFVSNDEGTGEWKNFSTQAYFTVLCTNDMYNQLREAYATSTDETVKASIKTALDKANYDLTNKCGTMFKPESAAVFKVGSDNILKLTLGSATLTKVYIGFASEASDDSAIAIDVSSGQKGYVDIPIAEFDTPIVLAFKGSSWTNRTVVVSQVNKSVTFLKTFEDATVEEVAEQTFTGSAIEPEVTFKFKSGKTETTLVKDQDYTVEYANNVNAGTATITAKGMGDYAGTKTAEFKINAKKITPAVTLSTTTYTYNGKAKTPAVTVKDGTKTLTKNTDYTVSYAKGRINAGSYKVTVTLKGNYSGSAYKTIKINPAAQKLTMSAAQKSVKFKALKKKAQTTSKVAVSGVKTKVTYAKVSGSSKLTINKTTGKITVKKKTKKGTYSIKVKATAAKSTNYKAATVTKTIKVRVK